MTNQIKIDNVVKVFTRLKKTYHTDGKWLISVVIGPFHEDNGDILIAPMALRHGWLTRNTCAEACDAATEMFGVAGGIGPWSWIEQNSRLKCGVRHDAWVKVIVEEIA